MNFSRNLHNLILNIFWNIFPKKYETIEGIKIPYVIVLPYILGGGFKNPHKALALIHTRLRRVRIFLTEYHPFSRYNLYHEHCEGEIYLQGLNKKKLLKEILSKFGIIAEVFGKTIPKSLPKKEKEALKSVLKQWVELQGPHAKAIVEEIELAKRELAPEKLTLFCQEIKENKRFGAFF